MENLIEDLDNYNPEDVVEPAPKEDTPKEANLPDKYKGKSLEEIVKMHAEAEKVISRQGNDIHELKRAMEDISKRGSEADPWAAESDFDVDKRVVDKLNKLEQELALTRRQREFEKFESKHSDWAIVTEQDDFQKWVKDSPYRLGLWDKASKTDYTAADELFSGWEEVRKDKSSRQEAPKEDLDAAQLEKRGRSGTRKPVFRSADLINLKITNPAKYEAMAAEIHEAYKDGRVLRSDLT